MDWRCTLVVLFVGRLLVDAAHETNTSCDMQLTVDGYSSFSAKLDKMEQEMGNMKLVLKQQFELLNKKMSSVVAPCIKNCTKPEAKPRDCAELRALRKTLDGVYTVYVGSTKRPVQVYCDMTTDGGGWTVIQRRQDGSQNFYRTWSEYAIGFGTVNREFWLGNENIHDITTRKSYSLRIDLADFSRDTRYAKYSYFKVGPAREKYRLYLGTYSGNAGDSLSRHRGMMFSAKDQDNDITSGSCAVKYKGAWWYDKCHEANLNGLYLRGKHSSYADGVDWRYWLGYNYSLKFTEMKIRP